MAKFDSRGREIPDPTPVKAPFNFDRPLSITEQIKRMVRQELSARAADLDLETFEESEDFECDEDDPDDVLSQYEIFDMQPETPGGAPDVDADPPPQPASKQTRGDGPKGSAGDNSQGASADRPANGGNPPAVPLSAETKP